LNLASVLAELRTERQVIDKVIGALEAISGDKRAPERHPRRGLHWTQRPENRAKVRRIMRTALRTRKAKAR